ncbi:MAG TPA: DUF3556 domain-containing protein [Nocardiopsis listeri]|uniref:DUF3556 domain-containing protein n=1 Tax=Nocardiopsis listeri TaxID=53440 RepID=UPI001DA41745|nr:DUF3556 domain-containing protein [Nocardiopsis listeri]HJE61253.1 DUF3556 domain-containing protein [Nocardiopsis listeri]
MVLTVHQEHTQRLAQRGRLLSVLMKNLPDLDERTVREVAFGCDSLIGFDFGDGHPHDEDLIRAVRERVGFSPGEWIVLWVESQPIHSTVQHHKVIDAALGVVERGTWQVADAVAEQPWLPNGPIPLTVTWTDPAGAAPPARSGDEAGSTAGSPA